uniref:Uncharacterized protein n=1 Tax=Leersia perrieri TaxID=77586 RepID=A0A0D9X3U5_9ORYZ
MAVVETSAAPPAREMRDLEDLLSKLNPMAEEFVPPSLASSTPLPFSPAAAGYYPNGGRRGEEEEGSPAGRGIPEGSAG